VNLIIENADDYDLLSIIRFLLYVIYFAVEEILFICAKNDIILFKAADIQHLS
jgi:hypothetical protein